MDLALTIFRIGVGAGALLIGLALLILVFSLRGLGRDARTLSGDLQRLNRLLGGLTSDESTAAPPVAEAHAEEPAPREEPPARPEPSGPSSDTWALSPPADDEPAAADEEVVGWWPGGASDRPVQSADEREDERIA